MVDQHVPLKRWERKKMRKKKEANGKARNSNNDNVNKRCIAGKRAKPGKRDRDQRRSVQENRETTFDVFKISVPKKRWAVNILIWNILINQSFVIVDWRKNALIIIKKNAKLNKPNQGEERKKWKRKKWNWKQKAFMTETCLPVIKFVDSDTQVTRWWWTGVQVAIVFRNQVDIVKDKTMHRTFGHCLFRSGVH